MIKENCYWYEYENDMGARIPYCKINGDDVLESCDNCEQYYSKYETTNADRLRAMTDEGIEDWYWWMHKEMMRYIDSRIFVHDWLKSPADPPKENQNGRIH